MSDTAAPKIFDFPKPSTWPTLPPRLQHAALHSDGWAAAWIRARLTTQYEAEKRTA